MSGFLMPIFDEHTLSKQKSQAGTEQQSAILSVMRSAWRELVETIIINLQGLDGCSNDDNIIQVSQKETFWVP